MDYLWLKALHIAAVVTWIGGMLIVAVTLAAVVDVRGQQEIATRSVFLERVRRWDRSVTSPAMLLAWALGLILAITGGWFQDGWMMAKIGLVLLLSAVHGVMTGRLRRLSRSQAPLAPGLMQYAGLAVLLVTLLIVVLVVIKPI
jgi:uncharacterized membrane protein